MDSRRTSASSSSSRSGNPPAPRPGQLNEQVAERLADTMFALSLPSRVQILICLRDGPRTVSELTEALGMEQSAVSHQLRVLREHVLVAVAREGRLRRYALHDEQVGALLDAALGHVERREVRLPRIRPSRRAAG